MKTTIKNSLKIAFFAIAMLGFSTAKAQTQTTDADNTKKTPTAIRLVDNKGTIKYLQSNNGITTITSTADNNKTTTTWQLGGTLVENTNISTGGKEFKVTVGTSDTDSFKISGLTLETGAAKTGTTTNWNVAIVSSDGTLKTVSLENLLQVKGGQAIYTGTTATAAATTIAIGAKTISGLPAEQFKVSVYRNGAKLEAGVDYTVAQDELTLVDRSASTLSPDDWTLYDGDKIEVVWIK